MILNLSKNFKASTNHTLKVERLETNYQLLQSICCDLRIHFYAFFFFLQIQTSSLARLKTMFLLLFYLDLSSTSIFNYMFQQESTHKARIAEINARVLLLVWSLRFVFCTTVLQYLRPSV